MGIRYLLQLQLSPYLEQCNDFTDDDHDLSESTFAWALDGKRTACVDDNDHRNNGKCMMNDEEYEDQLRTVPPSVSKRAY